MNRKYNTLIIAILFILICTLGSSWWISRTNQLYLTYQQQLHVTVSVSQKIINKLLSNNYTSEISLNDINKASDTIQRQLSNIKLNETYVLYLFLNPSLNEARHQLESLISRWQLDLLPALDSIVNNNTESSVNSALEFLVNDLDSFSSDLENIAEQLNTGNRFLSLINNLFHGISIVSLLLLSCVLWKLKKGSFSRIFHAGSITGGISNTKYSLDALALWNSVFRKNEINPHTQQEIASLNLTIDALTHLIEEPDSTEPFLMILNDIEQLTNAESSAIFITPDTSSQFVLLACTDPNDVIWSNTLPHKILSRTVSNEENQRIIEFHDEAQSPGFNYLFVFLNSIDQDFSFFVLKLPVEHQLTDANRLSLRQHSHRLSSIVASVRSARLKLRNVQYEERATIARELHDSLAQSLSYLKIQSSRLQSMLTDSDMQNIKNAMEIDAMMQDVRTTLNVAYRHLRELITTFRLTMGGKDFSQALNDSVEEFSKRSGIAFDVDNRLPDNILTVMEETQLLHIIRESLSNVVRHSHATSALVSIHYSKQGKVTASIEDDGIGLQDIPDPEHHFGIIIMQERAHSIDGEIKFVEQPDGGARLTVLFSAGKQINVTSDIS